MLEIVVENENETLPAITFNYDNLIAELQPKLDNYKNMLVLKEDLALAKKDRANLNNLAKAINAKKIEVKNKCLEPYANFEKQIKTILGMIDEASNAIDVQVKRIEQEEKDSKRIMYEQYYYNAVTAADLANIIPFEKVFNAKWLNTTAKKESVFKEIDNIVAGIAEDIAVINELDSEFYLELMSVYSNTLSIPEVFKKKKELQEKKEMLNIATLKLDNSTVIEYNRSTSSVHKMAEEVQGKTLIELTDISAQQFSELLIYMFNHNINYKILNGGYQ